MGRFLKIANIPAIMPLPNIFLGVLGYRCMEDESSCRRDAQFDNDIVGSWRY